MLLSLSVPVAAVASLSLGDCRLSSITDNLSLGLPTEKNLWFVSRAFWLADRVRGAPSLQMLSMPGEPLTLVVACPGFRCASLHCRPISSLPRNLAFPFPASCIMRLAISLVLGLLVPRPLLTYELLALISSEEVLEVGDVLLLEIPLAGLQD